MKAIAIVVPWYGETIRGGTEQEASFLAHTLQNAGNQVEVFTTCVEAATADQGTNTLQPGSYIENNILVRRFPVRKRNRDAYNSANRKLYRGEVVPLWEENNYYQEGINSPQMYHYIAENRANYQAFLFIPYLYGITYNGSRMCPDNAILIPCFRDEGYVHMELTRRMVEHMKGIIYLSESEKQLANQLFDLQNIPNQVLGAGIDDGWETKVNPTLFRRKYKISDPFILYVGQKDPGKKTDELIHFFCQYKNERPNNNLKLVLVDGDSIPIPEEHQHNIYDLGFLSLEDKRNALASAMVLCNPLRFERFSIVIMESWLVKRPVLVSEEHVVAKDFCQKSNGGLYYRNFGQFACSLDFLQDNNDIADKLGKNGFSFVLNNFTSSIIAHKYIEFIRNCVGSA